MSLTRTPLLLALLAAVASAQPWTARLRGSWVQTGTPADGDVTLTDAEIVVSPDEPSNVRQAAEFLAADILKISGRNVVLAATPAPGRPHIRLLTLGHGAPPAAANAQALAGQWESYRILTDGGDVWLIGSNPRGTAFAAYTLSERLGIDPLYIWTGYAPEHHDPLIVKATNFTQTPPTFKFRGFFHDDEDLLPRPFDANGNPLQTGDVPLEWYKRFFETALRLRMNMVAPYTRVHRRFEVQKLASDWGLYYTSHHYDILVSNPFGLERFGLAKERGVRPEWNWFTNREGMLTFWRGGVEENKNIDVIWPVGMRGTEDRPFTFPAGATDDQKAATFREVINDQVRMVRDILPKDKTPLFHFTMYNEMLPQYQRNPAAFDLPADVTVVWPDDNDGHMRALPAALGKWKHGVYYHLAYLGGRLSKQLTHTVGPSVIADQFDKIVKSGATDYMLVNVSEVRDYVMGARMLADITWDAPAIFAAPRAPERFTAWWSREYFPSRAEAVEAAYTAYAANIDTPDKLWFASDAIQDILAQKPLPANTLATLLSRVGPLKAAVETAARAREGMTRSEARFFAVDVELGLKVAERQTRAALMLADAPPLSRAEAALAPLEQLEIELENLEYPPFDRWYQQSWIRTANGFNNPHRPYQQLRAFLASH